MNGMMNTSFHNLLNVNQALFQKRLYLTLKETGLTPGQPKILEYLSANDGSVQKDIAAGCHIEPATVTHLLLRMEEDCLVVRRTENGNRRSFFVYLTEKGRRTARMVEDSFVALEEQTFSGFSGKERELLRSMLLRIYNNIDSKNTGEQENKI